MTSPSPIGLGLRGGVDFPPSCLAYVMGLFLTAFGGLVAGVFPYIIPGRLTIWEAIAPDKTVYFTLVGILIFIPVVIAYNIYAYRTFSGKTSMKDGY